MSADTAYGYAALILSDAGVPVSADKITALLKAANIKVDAAWAGAFAKLASLRKVSEFTALSAAPAGGAAPAAAAAPAAGGAAPAAPAASKAPAKKESSSEEELGMGLFD